MATAASETVKFVAAALGVQATDKELATPVQEVGSTCQAIASRSINYEQLLGGASVGAKAEVQQWLIWAGRELVPLMDEKLFKVNAWLETRTYMVGNTLTLVDLVVFAMTHPATTKFPVAQYGHFSHLLRWSDLVQSRMGVDKVTQTLSSGPLLLIKPLFRPPPPPPPPAAAPAASTSAAAKGDAKGATPAAAAAAAAKGATASAGPAAPAAPPAGGKKEKASKEAAAPAAIEGDGGKKDKGKSKEGGGKKEASAAPAAGGSGDEARIDMLDIRVGKIVKVAKHPNADALYLEEIDVGEDQPRQIISGLVKFVPIEEMQDRHVLVVCNLKPAKMREVMSYGMVLCASNDTHDKVVPVSPPEGVPLGERVTVQGYDQEPMAEVNPKKKNILELLFPDMKTNTEGVPCYKGAPFTTSKGLVTSPLPDAWVK